MKLFTATANQTVAATVAITAVDAVLKALNGTEALKGAGVGYTGKSMVKLAAEIICAEACIVAIEDRKVVQEGISRVTVPFGTAVRLTNGMGHKLSIVHTTLGTVITERNAQGWKRNIGTSDQLKEAMVAFCCAVPTMTATDLKESVAETRRSHRITPDAIRAAGERAEAVRLNVVKANDSWANINS